MSDSFNPSDPNQPGWFGMSGQGLTNAVLAPQTQALLGLAGGLAQAAMPSRMKVPLGAAIAMGAQGMGQGVQNSITGQAADNNLLFQRAALPAKIAMLGGSMGGGGQGASMPFGVPAPLGGQQSGGAAPLMQPGQALMMARFALANGQDAAAAKLLGLPQEQAGGAGYTPLANGGAAYTPGGSADPRTIQYDTTVKSLAENGMALDGSGRVQPLAGYDQSKAAQAAAVANAGVPATLAGQGLGTTPGGGVAPLPGYADAKAAAAGATSAASSNAAAQNHIVTVPARDPQTGLITNRTMTEAQAAQLATGGVPAADPVSALQTIPDAGTRTMAVNAAMKAGLPPAAWPAWISAVHNESGWNPAAKDGAAGEIGMGQVKPGTAQMMGIDPRNLRDPATNLQASAAYFGRQWQAAGGDPARALAGYNTGSVDKPDAAYVNPAMARLGAAPGIPGAPVMTPEQEATSKQFGERAGEINSEAATADAAVPKLQILQAAANQFTTGAGADVKLAAQKTLVGTFQQLGVHVPDSLVNSVSGGETIQKEGTALASAITKSLGTREAASVLMTQIKNMPNVTMSQGGYQAIVAGLGQEIQRKQDLRDFQQQWLSTRPSIAGMEQQFNQQHPPEAYASRVVPFKPPASAADAKPNVIYRTARGPMLWTGSGFVPPTQ